MTRSTVAPAGTRVVRWDPTTNPKYEKIKSIVKDKNPAVIGSGRKIELFDQIWKIVNEDK